MKTVANINGKLVEYDACDGRRIEPLYKRRVFKYIGKGFIYSVGGVRQSYTSEDVEHFWKYRASNNRVHLTAFGAF